jgi:hypothetical protein
VAQAAALAAELAESTSPAVLRALARLLPAFADAAEETDDDEAAARRAAAAERKRRERARARDREAVERDIGRDSHAGLHSVEALDEPEVSRVTSCDSGDESRLASEAKPREAQTINIKQKREPVPAPVPGESWAERNAAYWARREAWQDAYRSATGREYVWRNRIDGPAVRELLPLPVADLRARAAAFLRDRSSSRRDFERANCSLRDLAREANRLMQPGEVVTAAPAKCPSCARDHAGQSCAEHAAELAAVEAEAAELAAHLAAKDAARRGTIRAIAPPIVAGDGPPPPEPSPAGAAAVKAIIARLEASCAA